MSYNDYSYILRKIDNITPQENIMLNHIHGVPYGKLVEKINVIARKMERQRLIELGDYNVTMDLLHSIHPLTIIKARVEIDPDDEAWEYYGNRLPLNLIEKECPSCFNIKKLKKIPNCTHSYCMSCILSFNPKKCPICNVSFNININIR